jgi:hypothetical protein
MPRKHVSILLPDGLIDPGLIPAQSWASLTGKPVPIEALSTVTLAADKLVYADGVDSFATTDLTAYGRGLIGVADEAAFKAVVNLEIGVDIQAQIAAGTSAQYYRGDKSWQTLNQAAVAGLTTADSPTFAGVTAEGSDAFFVANFTGVGGNFSGLRFRKGGLDRYTNALNSSGDLVFSRFNSSGVYQADPLRLAADGAVQIPSSNTAGLQLYNTADQTTNYERGVAKWTSNVLEVGSEYGGTGTASRPVRFGVATVGGTTITSTGKYFQASSGGLSAVVNAQGSAGNGFSVISANSLTSGTSNAVAITPTYNQASGTAANTDLLINRTETAVGSGQQNFAVFQVAGATRARINTLGTFVSSQGNVSLSAWGTAGVNFRADANTVTDTSTAASGTAASAVFTSFAQPTLAATNSSVTTTDAATVYIANAPAAGTNQTITNPYALWVDGGTSRFDGVVRITDAAATTARLYILGGASGAPLVTLERTVGASARWNWSLAGGGLTFTDELGNNTPALNVFGTGGTNEIYVGQKGKTFSDANTSLISGTTFSSSAGTNVPGQSLTIQGGLGTGNAASGDVLIKVGTAQASGTTAQTSSTVAQFTRTGLNNTVIGATTPAAGSFTTLAASGALTTTNGTITTNVGTALALRAASNTSVTLGVDGGSQLVVSGYSGTTIANGLTLSSGNVVLPTGVTLYAATGDVYLRAGTGGSLRLGADAANNYAVLSSTGLAVTGNISATGTVSSTTAQGFVVDTASGGYSRWKIGGALRGIIGGSNQVYVGGSSDNFGICTENAGALQLGTNNNVRLTIASTGEVTATSSLGASGDVWSGNDNFALNSGTTDGAYFYPTGGLVISSTSGNIVGLRRRSSDGTITAFYRDTTQVGSISVTTTSTAYNTSSDARLKTDLGAFDLRDLAAPLYALKLRKYRWNVWGETERFAYGVFAQEAYETNPWMTHYDAQSDRWSVNWTAEMPNLIAAVQLHELGQQDHERRLEALETENAALRARVTALEAA